MEEMRNFIKVWALAISSALYCYSLSKTPQIRTGLPRLLLVLPVVFLFIALPFALTTINLIAPASFYLSWLGSSKLILFALGVGPLIAKDSAYPLSLPDFIAIALLPIKVKDHSNRPAPKVEGKATLGKKIRKAVVFVSATMMLARKDAFHRGVLHILYFVRVTLGLELVLAISAYPIKAFLGLELEPQFRDPYLSTSLQDFWGSRWNLMTSNILRLTVYDPIRRITSPMIGKRWGALTGLIASFTLSGIMHELTYYHYTRVNPTGEVSLFFVLHGVSTAVEVILKSQLYGKWRPHRFVSRCLTMSFVTVTVSWLFLPQLLRNCVDERLLGEHFAIVDYAKSFLLRS